MSQGPSGPTNTTMSTTNHLRRHRKRWALHQAELAHLVGFKARSVISSHEGGRTIAGLRAALAYQFALGEALATLFPGEARRVQDMVLRRAAALDEKYRDRGDTRSIRVREFLARLVERADVSERP